MSSGSVKLVNHMIIPGDIAIVNSAKQSYGRYDINKTELTSREIRILEFMMDKKHGTPFEAEVMSFQIRCTIKEARDWFRYRFSSYNEYSTRFAKRIDDVYIPGLGQIRTGSVANGKKAELIVDEGKIAVIQNVFREAYSDAIRHYERLLESDLNVSQELASMLYPLGQMTEFTWTVNARSLMNFLSQRMDGAAMLELRRKAFDIYALAEPRMPTTLALWTKYRQPDMMTDWSDDDMINIPQELRD